MRTIIRNATVLDTSAMTYDEGRAVVIEDGTIVDKLFNPHLANRDGVETVVDRFEGRVEPGEDEPAAAFSEDDGIEVTAFHPFSDDTWDGLGQEASRLVAFLADRDPTVYRRYARWWSDLPGAETRVLSG